jgi:pimeloyl-ACP methyl ester carboxylesterase
MLRAFFLSFFFAASVAAAQSPGIGVVLMHGKGGLPDGLVLELASDLERRGYLVANLEMPWSSRRDYDVDVAAGEKQVADAIADLRARGAAKTFVAGHSQGGTFALYVGGKLAVDGIVAIAPGGDAASPTLRQNLGQSVARARELVEAGQGGTRHRFLDYEGSRGSKPVFATAANYLAWFEPEGAMNQMRSIRSLDAKVPVLYIVPTSDYPGLLRAKWTSFGALPKNPLTKLYEPDANHKQAPTASREEIARWMAEVAGR